MNETMDQIEEDEISDEALKRLAPRPKSQGHGRLFAPAFSAVMCFNEKKSRLRITRAANKMGENRRGLLML